MNISHIYFIPNPILISLMSNWHALNITCSKHEPLKRCKNLQWCIRYNTSSTNFTLEVLKASKNLIGNVAKQPFIINKIDNKHKCIKSNYGHMEVKYSNGYCTLCNDWEHRLLHPLNQHCWDMILNTLLMWWKFNLITLPHHKMLQPWVFNIHKECHMPFNNQSYHIFDEHLLTKITCLLRN